MVASKFIQRMEVGISLHRLIYVRFVLFERSHIIICAQTAAKKRSHRQKDEKLTAKKHDVGNVQCFRKKRPKKAMWRACVSSLFIHCSVCGWQMIVALFSSHLMAFFTSHYCYYYFFLPLVEIKSLHNREKRQHLIEFISCPVPSIMLFFLRMCDCAQPLPCSTLRGQHPSQNVIE